MQESGGEDSRAEILFLLSLECKKHVLPGLASELGGPILFARRCQAQLQVVPVQGVDPQASLTLIVLIGSKGLHDLKVDRLRAFRDVEFELAFVEDFKAFLGSELIPGEDEPAVHLVTYLVILLLGLLGLAWVILLGLAWAN